MAEEIINRVAKSKLITLNLEDFYPSGKRVALDIKNWLFQGLILKEKTFRETLKNYNWSEFKNHYVAVFCSSEAIVPAWAYMLVQTHLNGISKKTVFGTLETLETVLFCSIIDNMDLSFCEGKPVIIKGCSDVYIPDSAYGFLISKLQHFAKKISYGEACSSVPLWSSNK